HRGNCGQIAVISFTLPTQLVTEPELAGELLEHHDLADLLPPIPRTAHKGQRGVLAVFAGSIGTAGAAVLASQSALSAGAGVVTVFADDAVYVPLASQLTSVMVRPDDGSIAAGPVDPGRFGAVVVGPGWGTSERRASQLVEIIAAFKTGVIDADGLTLLSAVIDPPSLPDWVLTPHPAELGRLAGASRDDVLADMYGFAGRAAEMYGAVVVAKASTTIIAHPDGRVAVVDGMNPSLATAGSGDVLAGVFGALLSRGVPAWDAARAGAVAHSVAGRRLGVSAGLFRSAELSPEIARVVGEIILRK
ncbi:MAG: NAD(P)H-hydrate dehydratase, partial [Spirochaetales bacterium]|nr:NAD(P)H-hydrate dehydratase [Spirochaetales bacterium]